MRCGRRRWGRKTALSDQIFNLPNTPVGPSTRCRPAPQPGHFPRPTPYRSVLRPRPSGQGPTNCRHAKAGRQKCWRCPTPTWSSLRRGRRESGARHAKCHQRQACQRSQEAVRAALGQDAPKPECRAVRACHDASSRRHASPAAGPIRSRTSVVRVTISCISGGPSIQPPFHPLTARHAQAMVQFNLLYSRRITADPRRGSPFHSLFRMTHHSQFAVALDMDGVIFQTTRAKHDAMLSLFPAEASAVASRTIWSLAGVPRSEKLATVHKACHGSMPTDAELHRYLSNYRGLLENALASPALIPGVASLVALGRHRAFVCSSAPEEEVKHALEAAGLDTYFEAVYGAKTSKLAALQEIAHKIDNLPLVFFGDAVANLTAATCASVGFVALTAEADQFGGLAVPKLKDFCDYQLVLEAVGLALSTTRTEPASRVLGDTLTQPDT